MWIKLNCKNPYCIMTNKHFVPVKYKTKYKYLYFLFLISMLWHRGVISNRNETSYLPQVRPGVGAGRLKHPLSSRLKACSQTDLVIEDEVKKTLNFIASSYDEQAFGLLGTIVRIYWHLALAIYIYIFLYLIVMLWHREVIFNQNEIVVFLWITTISISIRADMCTCILN